MDWHKEKKCSLVSNSGFIDIITEQVKTLEALEIQKYESALKYWIYKIMIYMTNFTKGIWL